MNKEIVVAHIKINTGMTVPQLAKSQGVSKQALYATLDGKISSARTRDIICSAAGKTSNDIWPDTAEDNTESAA